MYILDTSLFYMPCGYFLLVCGLLFYFYSGLWETRSLDFCEVLIIFFSFLVSIFSCVLGSFSISLILIKAEYLFLHLKATCLAFSVNYVFGLLFKNQCIGLSLLYFFICILWRLAFYEMLQCFLQVCSLSFQLCL